MASFGAKHPCFKPHDGVGVVLGKLVSANLTVNLASGEIYADDTLAEQVSEFSSGSLAMETDNMSDANASVVYGATVADGTVIYNQGDNPPMGVLAYYKVLMVNKVRKYKGFCYPSAKAALGNDNASSKGSSITFQTESTTFTIFSDDNGNWRETKTFDDEASAKAWVESKCLVGEYYTVNVSAQGADSGEGVSVEGIVYVAAGKDLTFKITGYAGVTAAYDNGENITSAITGGTGTYTITDIDADHTIAIIF